MNLFDRIFFSIFKAPSEEEFQKRVLSSSRRMVSEVVNVIRKEGTGDPIQRVILIDSFLGNYSDLERTRHQLKEKNYSPSTKKLLDSSSFVSDPEATLCQIYLTALENSENYISCVIWDEDPHFVWTEKLNYELEEFDLDNVPDDILYYDLKRDGELSA